MPHKGVTTLESEAYVELNLASNVNGGEYSSDVAGETARWIREHGVSVPAKRGRTLRVARDCKISCFRSQSCQSIWLLMVRLFRSRNRDSDRSLVVAHKKCNQLCGFVWLALADTR